MHAAINVHSWFVILVKHQQGKGGGTGKVQIMCPYKGHRALGKLGKWKLTALRQDTAAPHHFSSFQN